MSLSFTQRHMGFVQLLRNSTEKETQWKIDIEVLQTYMQAFEEGSI